MSGPISSEVIIDGLIAHMVATTMEDPASITDEELLGLEVMAKACIDYFTASVNGAPNGAAQTLMWAIFSGLWEKKVPSEEIDKFFTNVDIDVARIFQTWRALSQEEQSTPCSVVFIPGKLADVDINEVIKILFANQYNSNKK